MAAMQNLYYKVFLPCAIPIRLTRTYKQRSSTDQVKKSNNNNLGDSHNDGGKNGTFLKPIILVTYANRAAKITLLTAKLRHRKRYRKRDIEKDKENWH